MGIPCNDIPKEERNRRGDWNKRGSRWLIGLKYVALFAFYFLVAMILIGLAYAINMFIFQFTGRPLEVVSYLSVGVTGIILLFVSIGLFALVGKKIRKRNARRFQDPMTDALYQIAKGNFDVLVDAENHPMYEDLAVAINTMAKDLGSLETMRQDFISNVSHEIQSPLTSIKGFAALLQRESISDEERIHYAAIIEAESTRLSNLSDNLLKLTTLESDKHPLTCKDYRLDKQLSSIALFLEPQWAAKNIEIEAMLDTCEYRGDEELLSQVWMNLLHNAIKFTPVDGRIEIHAHCINNEIRVRIIDSGIGIADEDVMHVFERFYKVDKARDRALDGNGLGLPLAKGIVELHGGTIEVESTQGAGTTFIVYLPKVNEPDEAL